MQKLRSVKHVGLQTSLKAKQVSPLVGSRKVKSLESLRTVGLRMTPRQALDISINLLIMSKLNQDVILTAFREQKDREGNHHVTVTAMTTDEVEIIPDGF